MSYIRFHRGARQIGGCCTEFCSGDERILIDFGSNLPGTDEGSPVTDKQLTENVFGQNTQYGAVLFSHYHGDHYGLYKEIPSDIPLYMGSTAKEILSVVTEYIDRYSDVKGLERIKNMSVYHPGRPLQISGINEIKVIPLSVDHSALDAYMFYIEMAGKKILFTGDFRDHGIASENNRFWSLINSDKYIPSDIDLLITEGTMLSRKKEIGDNIVQSEAELGKAEIFRAHKYNFVLVSSTNLDSIIEFYHNSPDDFPFVCDLYQFRVICKAIQGKKDWLTLYRPKKTGDNETKPIYVLMNNNDSRLEEIFEENREKGVFVKTVPIFPGQEDIHLGSGFVMLARPDRYPENGKNRFVKILEKYSELDESDVSILYSMWKGYLYGVNEDKAITGFIGRHHREDLHVSGHAYPETIRRLIKETNPRRIIPMHTEMADEMAAMEEFSDYRERIIPMNETGIFDLSAL